MSVEEAPAETVLEGAGELAALDVEDATLAQALAEVEAGRAERVAAVDADEAALKAARAALWAVSRASGDPVRAGPHGAYHVAELEAAARQRTLDQRTAAGALEAAERAAGASRRAWVAGERRRSDLLMARARLGQRRHQLEHERARSAAAGAGAGDALRAIKQRLGLGA